MIDYSVNIYSAILMVLSAATALYALGQWAQKTDSSRQEAASKSMVDANNTLLKDRITELTRRVTDLERSAIRRGEFDQFQHRVDGMERALNSRMDDNR